MHKDKNLKKSLLHQFKDIHLPPPLSPFHHLKIFISSQYLMIELINFDKHENLMRDQFCGVKLTL